MTDVTAPATPALERRRRLSLRAAAIALGVATACLPLGLMIGGSDDRDTLGGALILAAIAGAIACPWIVKSWQRFMCSRVLAQVIAARPDVRHIDAERQPADGRQTLSSDAFSLGAFRDCGLVEPFESASVSHILAGDAGGVRFGLAEIVLLNAKGYRMFGGVLGSFRLAHPRPGLTIVTRDRGLLGNLLRLAGSAVENLPLEDPSFEGIFEVYGTDQVVGRVILTTTMLERLKALDEMTGARGFACAFLEDHLFVAFNAMSWRCPFRQILAPVDTWLAGYTARLDALVDLPAGIVRTLNLAPVTDSPRPLVPTQRATVMIESSSAGQVFTSAIWRVIGEGGMPLINLASGVAFGGIALFGAWYGVSQGYSNNLFWYFWGLITAGLAYGIFAIAGGLREIGRLAWGWNAPLRTLKRQ